jgi:hypothetical protein
MSFNVLIGQDLVPVEAGTTVPLSLSISNQGTETDRYEIEVEGIDMVWKAVPVNEVDVPAGQSTEEKIFFKPPRESESLAGHYPFLVKVRSFATGETKQVQGILEVKPFHSLSLEVVPRKGYVSATSKRNVFEVAVMNLGNTPHTVQLTGIDPEDGCTYEFESERVSLAPGQTRNVSVEVRPKKSSYISTSRLIGFTITGRSVEHGSVSTASQGQLEQRALLTPTSLAGFVVLLLVAVAWFLNRPKPPEVEISVEPIQVLRGASIKVSWNASSGSRVRILADGESILENGNPDGTYTLETATAQSDRTEITLIAEAKSNGMTSRSEPVTVRIAEPEKVPIPEILSLSASPNRVRVGSTFVLSYKFNDAVVSAMLGPDGIPLDSTLSRIEVSVPNGTKLGYSTYEVSAKNKLGQAVVKSLKVEVYDEADAAILEFKPSRTQVEPLDNAVSIAWHVTRAARVELKSSNGDIFEVEPKGEREFVILKKTTFTLIAVDDRNRRSTRQVTVDYKEPAPAPTSTDGGGGGQTVPPEDPPSTLSTGGTTGPSTNGFR